MAPFVKRTPAGELVAVCTAAADAAVAAVAVCNVAGVAAAAVHTAAGNAFAALVALADVDGEFVDAAAIAGTGHSGRETWDLEEHSSSCSAAKDGHYY